MDREMVEIYRHLRDFGKPISQRDAADYCAIRAPQPPSRAHLKRLERHRENRPFVEKPREYAPPSEQTKINRKQLDFFKSQMAMLGGTRTIAVPEPVEREYMYVEPVQRKEQWPEAKPLGPTPEQAAKLERDHLVALGRANIEISMFRILDAFGSFECFRKAVDNAF